jgi:hypothetical protein
MNRLSRRSTTAVLVAAVIVAAFQSSTSASHSWGGYHWARTQNPFTLNLADNVSASWDYYLTTASGDWNRSPVQFLHVLNTVVVPGQTNPRTCRPTSGRVEVCNALYGNTGWLGVAQIWIGSGHIAQGTVKVNDTYFNTAKYNDAGWKQMVVCQEIGHTFGLDHQDVNFDNTNLGTCMDYTSNPYGPLSNLHPNDHDYEELAFIYAHTDSLTTIKSAPGASGANAESRSEWGQLMKTAHGGRTQVFERDFGNGQHIVTFVIWA